MRGVETDARRNVLVSIGAGGIVLPPVVVVTIPPGFQQTLPPIVVVIGVVVAAVVPDVVAGDGDRDDRRIGAALAVFDGVGEGGRAGPEVRRRVRHTAIRVEDHVAPGRLRY